MVAGGAPRPGRAAADGDGARLAGASAADGPLSGLREKLCGMAADCLYLPRDKVDPDAEFTAIGLDSVLAVEFVSLTNAEFGTSLTIQALREHPTVAELAVYLSQSASRPREEAGR